MSIQVRRYALVIVSCCLAVVLAVLWSAVGGAKSGQNDWLVATSLRFQKILDLPANVQPAARNLPCASITYRISNNDVQDCVGNTMLGTLSADGKGWYVDDTTVVPLKLNGGNSVNFFPLPSSQQIMAIDYATGNNWNKVGFYANLQRKDLAEKYIWRGWYARERQFWLTKTPDYVLRDASGKDLLVNTGVMAVSAGARWLVADTPAGLVWADLADSAHRATIFASSLEAAGSSALSGAQLAISGDGQYVALSRSSGGGTAFPANLTVYDLKNCTTVNGQNRCASRDLWNANGGWQGATALIPKAARLANVRFADNDTIRFDAVYNTNGNRFDVATFVLTTAQTTNGMGLLGMGDSYISGEGAYTYIKGTNSGGNHCHQSLVSYPFLLGAASNAPYDSVACSGAKTTDIYANDSEIYKGQVTDRVEARYRDKPAILQQLAPGYLVQNKFVEQYKPESIVLSIGGNDIGFGDIVSTCVAAVRVPSPFDLSSRHNTCFASYEDRYELVQAIKGKFNDLVATYQDIRNSSPATRIYVVGYPHIAQPGGSCGINVLLDTSEVQFSEDLIDYLNNIIAQAAAKAGVRYADMSHVFDGHKLCESGEKAVNGLTAGDDTMGILGSESYHPNAYGHQLLASAIWRATSSLSVAMPAPQPNASAPAVDDSLALLRNAQKSGRKTMQAVHIDGFTKYVWIGGQQITLHVDGLLSNFAMNSPIVALIHSEVTHIATLQTDANGDIDATLTVPAGLTPGFHTLHLQGKDMNGNDVNAWQAVYIAASPTDYDGDGTANAKDSCAYLTDSGVDSDQDGIDDVCDGEYIAAAASTNSSAEVPVAPALTSGTAMPIVVTTTGGTSLVAQGNTSGVTQPAASSEVVVETGHMLAMSAPDATADQQVSAHPAVKALQATVKNDKPKSWSLVLVAVVLLLAGLGAMIWRQRRVTS
ncbi:MAG TPA: SGNH/GDSL hydrolase family protein [Candidatus Saccharimonadales bacterium]|nr:SGNH/GDSL hydrolase family protein [Candidatus Saccharimonadales bacterium]